MDIRIKVMPLSSFNFFNRFNICACTETSSELTGSSAMIISGCKRVPELLKPAVSDRLRTREGICPDALSQVRPSQDIDRKSLLGRLLFRVP